MTVRDFQPSDAEGVVALNGAALGRRTTPEQLLADVARMQGIGLDRRWVLVEAGDVLGTARLNYFPFAPPEFLQALVVVHPDRRGQGRGETLWQILRRAVPASVPGLMTSVRDDDSRSLAWAGRRGFTRQVHRFASELDLLTFDPAPFQTKSFQ